MAEPQPISIDTVPTDNTGFSIDVETTMPVPSDIASERAFKAKTGIPKLDYSYSDLYDAMVNGKESQMRDYTASFVDAQKESYKVDAISKIASKMNRAMTTDELAFVRGVVSTKSNTDPESVFEHYYSSEFMDNVRHVGEKDGNPPWKSGEPSEVDRTFFLGKDYMAKQEVVKTFLQNAQETAKNQGWGSYEIDVLKGLVPGYAQIKERARLDTPFFQGHLGENLDVQARNYFSMPFDEAKKRFLAEGNQLLKDNPSLAVSWANSILSQSYEEKLMNNSMGLLDIPAGGLAKMGASMLGRRAATEAAKTAIKSARTGTASRSLMAEAAGDLSTAAVEQVTQEMGQKMAAIVKSEGFEVGAHSKVTANPVVTELKGLPDSFVGHVDEINENSGNFSKELTNRLRDRASAMGNAAVEAVTNSLKTQRVPAIDAVRQFMERVLGDMNYQFPGINNRILNNSIRYDKGLNVHWLDYFIGDEGARSFSTAKVAASFAKEAKIVGTVEEIYGPFLRGKVAPGAVPKASEIAERAVKDTTKIQDNIVQEIQKLREAAKKLDRNSPTFEAESNANVALQAKYIKRLNDVKAAGEPTPTAPIVAPKQEASILQTGGRYVIKVSKPLPETAYVVREGLLDLKTTMTPTSWLKSKIGMYITPNETLSSEQTAARLAATYGPKNLYHVAEENAREVQQLRQWALPFTSKRQKWNEWKDIVSEAQNMRDEAGNPKTLNGGELNNLYMNKYHRLPDEQEVGAYYAHKREELIIQTFDALNQYKGLHRVGAQAHTIQILDSSRATAGSVPVKKLTFNGSLEREFPSTGDPVLFIDKNGNAKVQQATTARGIWGENLKKSVKEGNAQVIKLSNPEHYPFNDIPGGKKDALVSHAIIENKVESKNINWQDLTRARIPDYEYEHYVSQAVVKHDPVSGKKNLVGDRVLAGFMLRAEGKDYVKKIDTIRALLHAGKDAEAEAFHAGTTLPHDWKTVLGWFKGETISAKDVIKKIASPEYRAFVDSAEREVGEGMRIKPILSLEDPIKLVPRHKKVVDMDNELVERYGEKVFHDRTKNTRAFGQQEAFRDPFTVKNEGTRANPLYNVAPATYVDPITSINRAMNKVVESSYMDDYKTFSIEHWIQEAKDYLNVPGGINELRTNPYHYFFNPTWKETPENFNTVQALKTARAQIQQFVGIQNANTTFLHAISQQLADTLYAKGLTNTPLVATWLLPKLRDPFSTMRSLTMDMKMGLFAVPQLMVQMNTFTNIFGIAGAKYAAPGSKAMLLHQYARYNSSPEMLAHLDKLASTRILPGTSVYRPGEFTEARQLLATTGFEHVGNEHIRIDSPWFDIVKNERGQFLNAGRIFFREGEKSTRLGAWYTAYREFRDLNPTRTITEADTRGILQRADLLTTNMSRASASTLQQGIWSIPTQFLSYQIRLAELFMGKRLTQIERMRMFGTNALMYGLPIAFGLTGLPLGDWLRKEALENGYVVGDNWVNHLVTEGLPSTMMNLATGGVNPSTGEFNPAKGTTFNFGERYGSTGFEPFKEALRSDKTFLNILGGAAFSTFGETIKNMSGWSNAFMDMVKQKDQYKLKFDDFVDPFLSISSVASAKRLTAAWNTGKWITRNEGYVSDVGMGTAIFQTLSGLSSQQQQDTNTLKWIENAEKEEQKNALNAFIREWRRAIEDSANNDPQQSEDRIKRALVYLHQGGYPMEDVPKAIALAAQGWEPMIDRAFREFYTKNVPDRRKPAANDAYMRTLQQKAQ